MKASDHRIQEIVRRLAVVDRVSGWGAGSSAKELLICPSGKLCNFIALPAAVFR